MKALASIVGGLCVIKDGSQRQFVNVVDMSPLAPETAHFVCGAIDDWEVIDLPHRDALLREVRDRHDLARGLANIEACLSGVSTELQKELLGEVEDLLKALDARNYLAAMLLRAPLVSTDGLKCAIHNCLSEGLGATAELLEYVRESQPLLQRLADRWLSLPDTYFVALPGGRQQAWQMAVVSDVVLETLRASRFKAVEQGWASLAFRVASPAQRRSLFSLAKAVAEAFFPDHAEPSPTVAPMPDTEPDETSEEHRQNQPRGQRARAAFERAMKELETIATAVAEGRDAKARDYLNDLVAAQMGYSGGEEYAVKSLCNIAQQCADMFRTDFEYECLRTAIGIKPGDAWTLVQLADHFKRVGRFADAIDTLRQAEDSGDSDEQRAAQRSLADVYVRMGRFEEAIAIYETRPVTERDEFTRGAIADVLRRWGYLDEAGREYDSIVYDGFATDRVFAGKAEIAKRQGRLDEARDLYRGILANKDLDVSASFVYRMSLANVLVRMGELTDAYIEIDAAVQQRPFAREARTLRAAVAGLLGNPGRAIDELPQLGQTRAFNEWVSEYVRGLLLLMLDRYEDACEALLRQVEEKFLDTDSGGMLRLGAAVCFLQKRAGVERAAEILAAMPELKDAFADALRAALQYHVAIALRQSAEIKRLETQLSSVKDGDLRAMVAAIRRADWTEACRLEVRTLLRLAA
jgi:tetratricopeptide (TPR) repeat protein